MFSSSPTDGVTLPAMMQFRCSHPSFLSPAGLNFRCLGLVAGCIRDAAPDGWGQRVIENRLMSRVGQLGGLIGGPRAGQQYGLLTYLLESGSNRIGALDFSCPQPSASRAKRRSLPSQS